MSRKGFKLYKCERIDRISQLPDDIITHILSFLPLECAIATSILSTRWLDLWKYTPDLILIRKGLKDTMINFLVSSLKNAQGVNSVLNSYKSLSIRQFTISINMHQMTYHHVSKWLHFVFTRQVESLRLDFQYTPFVLDLNTLSGVPIRDYRFLKELTLEKFHASGEAMEFLLRNCSLLERLSIQINLESDLVIRGTSLKYLDIHPRRIPEYFIKNFTPNLTRLSCNYDYEMLFLENVPKLVEASFDFVVSQCTTHHFPNAAAKLEILSISLLRPKVFSVPQMSKLKKSVLDYHIVNREYLLPVTRLLQASPYIEEFKFEISDLKMYFLANLYKAILEVPKHGRFRYMHYHLKVFEFAGFCDKARDHVELVMYIVNNCVALEEIIITPICHAIAREFQRRTGLSHPILDKVDAIDEERHALAMKRSTERLLAGIIPHHIKLIIK